MRLLWRQTDGFMSRRFGRVTVLAAGGESPKVLHQADFGERISATPALIGNMMYLRTAGAMYAFGR